MPITPAAWQPRITSAARLAPLVAALALAGCSGLAPRRPALDATPQALPSLATPSSARIDASLNIERWWMAFEDAELHRLVEQALAHNADLAVAAARLREAQARLAEARGGQMPNLQLQGTSARARASADSLGATSARMGSSHELALVGQFEVDLWGRLAAGTEAARAQLAAQEWAQAAVQWSVTAQVAEAHFTLRGLARQAHIAQAVRASRAQTVALRHTERRAGAASDFDVHRAEAELAAADATLASLQRQRLASEAALSLLTGEAVASLGLPRTQSTALNAQQSFAPQLPASPQGDLAAMLQRRPDVRQAQALLSAAHADGNAAHAAKLPTLRLSGSLGSDVRELSQLLSGPGFAWSVASGFAQSLFDGGRLQARAEQADARAEAALAQYQRSVAQAVIELRETLAALDVQQQSLQAERQRVAALERAHQLAQLGLRAGALSQLDALDAERNHFSAQLAEVDAYRVSLIGQVAVFKALGGGHSNASLIASNTGTQP